MTTPKCRERFVYQEVYASLKRHHSQIQYHMSYMYIVVTYIYTMQILVSFIHRCLEMRLILGEMLHVLKTVAENNNRWCQLVHWTVMNRCWSILFMFSSHLYINLLLVWNKTRKPTLKGQGWFLRKTWLTKKTTIFFFSDPTEYLGLPSIAFKKSSSFCQSTKLLAASRQLEDTQRCFDNRSMIGRQPSKIG